MRKTTIYCKLKTLLETELGIDLDPDLDWNFEEHFSKDELEKIEFMILIENEFNIVLDAIKFNNCKTLSNVIDYIMELKNETTI